MGGSEGSEPRSGSQGASCGKKYEDLDRRGKAAIRLYANSLVGEASVSKLLHRMGYSDEDDLCRKTNRSLIQYFEEGDVCERLHETRTKLRRGMIGYY